MESEVKNINELREFLLRQFRCGDKWVAFDPFANRLTKEDVACFKTLEETSGHCETTYMAFKSLAAALREINGESRQPLIDRNKLQEQIAQHLVESFIPGRDLVSDLGRGELQPVICNKLINPGTEIKAYHLIQHSEPNPVVGEYFNEWSIIGSYSKYGDAGESIKQKVKECLEWEAWEMPNLIMLGEFKTQRAEFNERGWPERNTAIVFVTARPYLDQEEIKFTYQVNHLQDAEHPVLKQPMLAKFNMHSSKLEFYDGKLQKVDPGAVIEFMKIGFYDFQPLKIGNAQKNSITVDEKLNQQKKQLRHSNKMRNGLS